VLVRTPRPHRFALVLARKSESGTLCLANETGPNEQGIGSGSTFDCLDERNGAVLPYVFYGGPTGGSLTWAYVVGLARRDVSRLVVRYRDGTTSESVLKAWGAFPWRSFVVRPRSGGLPAGLNAFGAHGVLARIDVSPVLVPPCSGGYDDPCRGSPVPQAPWDDVADPLAPPERLTKAQVRETRRLALSHPLIRRILGGGRSRIAVIGRWTRCDGAPIGTVIDLVANEPADVEADFPLVDYNPRTHSAYTESVVHMKIEDATRVSLHVDLNRHRVVGIDPSEGATVVAEHVVSERRPAGGPDPVPCDESD
jgi:hypothetical protein